MEEDKSSAMDDREIVIAVKPNREATMDEFVESKMMTFTGRFLYFVDVTKPSTLLYSEKTIESARTVINEYKRTGIMCGSDSDMWRAYKVYNSAIHPTSEEIINPLFRVSAIAPVNIPIVFGMLLCPPTNVLGTMALHWINQSYNSACNYANRAGDAQPVEQIAVSYSLAVSSACAFAYGLGRIKSIKRFSIIIPFAATAAANISNICLTRQSEITRGAPVKDEHGTVHGLSKRAGIQGVAQSAVTRCLLVPMSCLCFPPVIMAGLKSARMAPTNPRLLLPLELSIIYASLQAALPAALAVFPQTCAFAATDLEKEFHDLRDSAGRPVGTLYSNKGL